MGIDQVVVGADCPMRHFDGPRLVGRQDEARKNGSVARQCVGVAGVHLNGANHRCQETHKQFISLQSETGKTRIITRADYDWRTE